MDFDIFCLHVSTRVRFEFDSFQSSLSERALFSITNTILNTVFYIP